MSIKNSKGQVTSLTSGHEYEKELTRLFNRFNKHYYNNALPEVMICILPTPKAHGHLSSVPRWVSDSSKEERYELNISALDIDRDPEHVCATLLHEMVHLYCRVNDIKETSSNHKYHNKEFKRIAEDHGLDVKHSSGIGWSITTLDEHAKKYVKKLNVKRFELHRTISTSKTKLLRYQCAVCKKTVCWCSKEQFLICGRCGSFLVVTPTERVILRKEPGI